MNRLCIVVPCYNEEEALEYTNTELTRILLRLTEAGKLESGSLSSMWMTAAGTIPGM